MVFKGKSRDCDLWWAGKDVPYILEGSAMREKGSQVPGP